MVLWIQEDLTLANDFLTVMMFLMAGSRCEKDHEI